jgi:putative oxidoreductase
MVAYFHCKLAILESPHPPLNRKVFFMSSPHSSQATGAALLRIALGTMWVSHALLKVLVFTLAGAAGFFASVGLPGFLVYPVVAAELLGGTAILLGFHGRLVSLLLTPILIVATWVHLPNGWVFSNANGGWEYPAFLLVASLAHALLGDGRWTLRRGSALAIA